ncbi:1-deoxy-D-xylulose 5-phosphate reductoisomerase [Alphaproteobacteria bacterium SO-S41]|nr:1-deoxy-D-xylulose 5-phosphate reductoisomerase [Alphaproteobacteria bacterium SO-S41]
MTLTVSILGSTGSVGKSTLDVLAQVRATNQFDFAVEALTAKSSAALLADQAIAVGARIAVVEDEAALPELRTRLAGTGIEVAGGRTAIVEAATRPAAWTMAAIVGAAGLAPTLAAVRQGGIVALANKECLVSAGGLFTDEVKRAGATLLPVDSEHNAIFQVFDFERPESIERIQVTASGGPFRKWTREAIAAATPEQARRHPVWEMGIKISIDSATLMNKGLELIEAHYLFGIDPAKLEVLVHPQSIIHSLVSYADGSVLAHLGSPDMRVPIAHALAWPRRIATNSTRLDLAAIGSLSFEAPDLERFPCLALAQAALHEGNAAPAVLNAANEVAVDAFLGGKIGFSGIAPLVEAALNESARRGWRKPASLEEVDDLDAKTRTVAAESLIKAA